MVMASGSLAGSSGRGLEEGGLAGWARGQAVAAPQSTLSAADGLRCMPAADGRLLGRLGSVLRAHGSLCTNCVSES